MKRFKRFDAILKLIVVQEIATWRTARAANKKGSRGSLQDLINTRVSSHLKFYG